MILIILSFGQKCAHSYYDYKIKGAYDISERLKSEQIETGKSVITGSVVDMSTGLKLVYANIFIENTNFGGIVDRFGVYTITIPSGTYRIGAQYVGNTEMQTTKIKFESQEKATINFKLGSTGIYQK